MFYLDANRSQIDVYNMGWKLYQQQRESDEKRRKRERQNAEKKAAALHSQADKMRAKATKTVAAQNMARRADKLLSGLEAVRQSDKVAKLRFPEPRLRQDALMAEACRSPTARWRSSPTSTWPSTRAPGSSSSA